MIRSNQRIAPGRYPLINSRAALELRAGDERDYLLIRDRMRIRAEWLEHVEWRDACADMRRREANWLYGVQS